MTEAGIDIVEEARMWIESGNGGAVSCELIGRQADEITRLRSELEGRETAMAFIRKVADLRTDGEVDDEGEDGGWGIDYAFETLDGLIERARSLSLSPAPTINRLGREEIARIIDPEAWEAIDGHRVAIEGLTGGAMPSLCVHLRAPHEEAVRRLSSASLAKADAILSLSGDERAATSDGPGLPGRKLEDHPTSVAESAASKRSATEDHTSGKEEQ